MTRNGQLALSTMAYVGRCPVCKGWEMLTVDDPRWAESVAKNVAKSIAVGCTVERMTRDEAVAIPTCECADMLRRMDLTIAKERDPEERKRLKELRALRAARLSAQEVLL